MESEIVEVRGLAIQRIEELETDGRYAIIEKVNEMVRVVNLLAEHVADEIIKESND